MVDPSAFAKPLLTAILNECQTARSEIESLGQHSTIVPNAGWGALEDQGRFHQRMAHAAAARVMERGGFLLALDVPARRREFEQCMDTVDFVIRQENSEIFTRSPGPRSFDDAGIALARVEELLKELQGHEAGWPVVVPDTNVLIDLVSAGDPATSVLEWHRLRGSWSSLAIWVVPPVVRELDDLKLKLRADKPRCARVKAVIRELEASFSQPHMRVCEGMISVNFGTAEVSKQDGERFEWFDHYRMDHRILAAVLDTARRNPRDGVYLATSDLHMRLLAKYLSIKVWAEWPPHSE